MCSLHTLNDFGNNNKKIKQGGFILILAHELQTNDGSTLSKRRDLCSTVLQSNYTIFHHNHPGLSSQQTRPAPLSPSLWVKKWEAVPWHPTTLSHVVRRGWSVLWAAVCVAAIHGGRYHCASAGLRVLSMSPLQSCGALTMCRRDR